MRQIVACYNVGQPLAYYAIWSEHALRQINVQAPQSEVAQPVPPDLVSSLRVSEVHVLPDGRIAAVWEQRGGLSTITMVTIMSRQADGRYMIDEVVDMAFAATPG